MRERSMKPDLAALLVLFLVAAGAAQGRGLVLSNVNIVDVDVGEIVKAHAVVVSDGRIERIDFEAAADIPPGATRLDAAGRYLIPALWDMHVHMWRLEDLALLVATGVGGVRIMSGIPEHLQWRARIELDELAGPRLLVAGPIVEGRPPPGFANVVETQDKRLIGTAAEGVAEVRKQKAAGFDFIKVYNGIPPEAYRALIAEAVRQGIPVAGHVPFSVGIDGALAARQVSIEHLRGYVEKLVPAGAPVQPGVDLRSRTLAWEYADPTRMSKLVRETRAAGAWQCPTLMARIFHATPEVMQRYLASSDADFMSARMRDMLRHRDQIKWLSNFSAEDYERAARGFARQDALLRAMHAAGVPLLAGTDMAPLGFSLHGELEHLAAIGLSPAEVLRTASVNPARFAGLETETGRVATGYAADLVLLDGNPLENIRNTRRIHAVILRGRLFDRAALDDLLSKVKAHYASGEIRESREAAAIRAALEFEGR